MNDRAQALAGIRVVDLTHALAGPFATYHLALQGASVLKIEPPGRGDEFRAMLPVTFAQANAGKRSLTLDLRQEAGRAILDRLIAEADLLVENFRPGVAATMGLNWERLSALNARLIFCSISGFGQVGALRDMPAIEWSAQAISGLSATYVDDAEESRRLGVAMLDAFAGYMGFAAMLTALMRRQGSGRGERLDIAMLDSGWVLHAPAVAELLSGRAPPSMQRRPTAARFRAKDRRLFIALLIRKWFEALCEVMGAPELLADPRFADDASIRAHGDEFVAEIERRLAARPADEWERLLVARGVPAGVIRTIAEMASTSHVRDRALLRQTRVGGGGPTLTIVGAGFGGGASVGDVPALGEHTDQVLGELGYDEAAIAELRAAKVV